MKTLKSNPELMTVIINIQTMKDKIYPYYDKLTDFKLLENLPEEQLYRIQDNCIKDYNATFNN
jgi:vacuolar-type H+-ATPase subunit B/Vma2